MKPATNTKPKRKAGVKILATLAKLDALAAAPGTPEEGKRAAERGAAIRARYDCTRPEDRPGDIFYGRFQRAPTAIPIADIPDLQIESAVKWAIENQTGIPCTIRGAQLCAEAAPATAAKLGTIAATISHGFRVLWQTFQAAPVVDSDRSLFYRGLYDGMMNDQRQNGEPLPARTVPHRKGRTKRQALGHVAGLHIHPYSVAVDLGRQLRFSTPIADITAELQTRIAGAIAA